MPLSHTLIEPVEGEASAYILFLHGILGSKSNWRSIATKVLKTAPKGWGAALVDLRMHGDSQAFSGPHTVSAAAQDLEALRLSAPIQAVLGHSFGGKVALSYASNSPDVRSALLVDSNPGPRPNAEGSESTVRVLDLLDTMPKSFDSREVFVTQLTEGGLEPGIARWLAMNLRADGTTYRFGLDLTAIRSLLNDYFAQDLWPLVEQARDGLEIRLLIADNSTVFSAEDRARALALTPPNTEIVKNAGHWVHVEQPSTLVAWVAKALVT